MALNFSDPFFLSVLAGTVISAISLIVLTTSAWDAIQKLNQDVWGNE